MKSFIKSCLWFINKSFYFYGIHPKQFHWIGLRLHRRIPKEIYLSENFSISWTLLNFSNTTPEKVTQEISKRKIAELREEMRKMGIFVSKWEVDCELRRLAKIGDSDRYSILSIGTLRKW